MKRSTLVLAIAFYFLALFPAAGSASAKDSWVSVRSKNFFLVGNASEKEVRQVGIRLEQFREAFSILFTRMNFKSPVPTTVIVFKNDNSYRPFKPNPNAAGYFQAGPDVNYITLTAEVRGEQDPFTVIFHEYTHLLVNNTSGNMPAWFSEGLAEYYSTFGITDDLKFRLGKVISSHVYRLRDKMLPLRTLFQVDHESPYYNERDKQSIFYAESWALVHYLILGQEGRRVAQLGKFLDMLSANVPADQAFQKAFEMSFESMEKELREYIKRNSYPMMSGHFKNKLGFDTTMTAAPVTEAEAQAYLGDLLLHSNRADCEGYLQKALALDPKLAMANASMGVLQARQGKSVEARKSLERALAANSQNYLIHYYYAFVLSREGKSDAQVGDMQSAALSREGKSEPPIGDMLIVSDFPAETASKIREELKKAIELRPDFPESYSLLAFVNLVTNTQIDESVDMMKRALATSPGRNDLVFMLAQLYTRKEDFKTARQLFERLISNSNDLEVRTQSQALLAQLTSIEEEMARFHAARDSQLNNAGERPVLRESVNAGGTPPAAENVDPSSYLREALRKPEAGETRMQGQLARIDCDAKGIMFVVKVDDRLLKLKAVGFEQMIITSFSSDAGSEISCGPRKPENNVIVSYVRGNEPPTKVDGVIRSLEFVPKDFKLNPQP
jgi:predicted Zn-dependent protease